MRDGVIKGGMIPKADCCVEAVRKGVKMANIQTVSKSSTRS